MPTPHENYQANAAEHYRHAANWTQQQMEAEHKARVAAAGPALLKRLRELVAYIRECDEQMFASDVVSDAVSEIRRADGL